MNPSGSSVKTSTPNAPRDYVDAIRYLVKEGIQWRAMPADFPPCRTVYDVLDGWQNVRGGRGDAR